MSLGSIVSTDPRRPRPDRRRARQQKGAASSCPRCEGLTAFAGVAVGLSIRDSTGYIRTQGAERGDPYRWRTAAVPRLRICCACTFLCRDSAIIGGRQVESTSLRTARAKGTHCGVRAKVVCTPTGSLYEALDLRRAGHFARHEDGVCPDAGSRLLISLEAGVQASGRWRTALGINF